jgi:hypothetical protein
MIHHFSIPARDPARVASALAELLGGTAQPFRGPLAGAFMVAQGDAHGTAIEVYPESTALTPGPQAQPMVFGQDGTPARAGAFHALLSVPCSRARVEEIGAREGWRTAFFGRAAPGRPPAFHVIEFWVENRLLLELVTEDMRAEYEAYMQPENYAAYG